MSREEQGDLDRALAVAGLLGEGFPRVLAEAVLERPGVVLELVDAGVLGPGDRPGTFRVLKGEAAQEAVDRMSLPERRQLWRSLAEAAKGLRLPEGEIARMYGEAGDRVAARRFRVRAAAEACVRKAYPEALLEIRAALEIWPWTEDVAERQQVLKEAARCAAHSGDVEAARQCWGELADFARDTGHIELQVEAHGQLARLAVDTVEAAGQFRAAAELAESRLAGSQAVRPMLEYVDHLASRVRIGLAGKVLERAVRLAEASGEAALVSEVRGWQGLLAAMGGRHDEARRHVEESLRIALESDLPEEAALAYRRRANIAEYSSDYAAEVESHRQAIRFCRKTGVGDQSSCLSCLAYATFRTGDWKEAARSVRAVRQDTGAHSALLAMADCVEGLMASFRGNRKSAERLLNAALEGLRRDGLLGLEFFAHLGLAYQDSLNERGTEATSRYDEIRALWRESEDLHDVLPALLFAGGHYAHAVLPERLADCIDIVLTILSKNPLAEARATLEALRGEQALMAGDRAAFVKHLQSATTAFNRIGLPLERIWTESSAALIAGRSALSPEGTALARRLGLRPILSLFETRPAAGPPPRCDLTPRQHEVLVHLAAGLTSKEIADRLSLSPRTVEMHVARLLERMNCRTRPEAVRLAAERGWISGAHPSGGC